MSEYLSTSYRPDCDYVDGEVRERHLGEQPHGLVQLTIGSIFLRNRRSWGLRPITEQRVQVTPTRFQISDVCVVRSSEPIQPILLIPPVLCIEVLSPDDRSQRIHEGVDDYLGMGVPHVWIIDPVTREIWTASMSAGTQPMQEEALSLPGTGVHIPVSAIFEELDEAPGAYRFKQKTAALRTIRDSVL